MKAIKTTRDITQEECHWLDEDIIKGTELFIFDSCTYGCISVGGVAVTKGAGENPFFELPIDSIEQR